MKVEELYKYSKDLDALYVEDDERVREDTLNLLERFFHKVDVAPNGVEGLRLFTHKAYDIVITDVMMPQMSGTEMVTHIRQINPSQKIVAISGQNDTNIIINMIRAGINGFILKPIVQSEFLSTLYPVCKEVYVNNLNEELNYELIEKKELLEKRNKELQTYVEILDATVLTSSTNPKGIITNVSKSFCNINGYTKEELIGKHHNIFRDPSFPKSVYKELWSELKKGNTWHGEIRNLAKNGQPYWVDVKIEPQYNEYGTLEGYTAIKFDITDKKLIEKLSITDGMTNLYNRRHFNDLFEKEINRSRRNDSFMALMIIDVDHFKQYNDTYGHFLGDQALIKVASVLDKCLSRSSDFAFRLGGEEFGAIFSGVTENDAKKLCQKILSDIEDLKIEHQHNSASPYLTVSCGLIVQKGNELFDANKLYQIADKALYNSKEHGRNQVTCTGGTL